MLTGILLVGSMVLIIAALGGLSNHAFAVSSGVSGKITFLPWDGKGGIIVFLPPASGIGSTTSLLPPAIVGSGLINV